MCAATSSSEPPRRASRRRTTPSRGPVRPRTPSSRTTRHLPRLAPCSETSARSQTRAASSSTTRSPRRAADAAHGPPVASRHAVAVAHDHVAHRPVDREAHGPAGAARRRRLTRAAPRAAGRGRRPTSTSRTTRGSAPCPGSRERARPRWRAPRRAPSDPPGRETRRASSARSGLTTSTRAASSARQRSATAAAWSNAHAGRASSAASRPASERGRPPVRLEARRAGPGLEAAVHLVAGLREVARRSDPEPLGVGDDQGAGRVRAAQPLLAGDREEVEPGGIDRDRADRLRAVDEHGDPGLLAQLAHGQHAPRRPEHLRQRQQPRPGRDRGADRVGLGIDDDDPGPRRGERPEEAEMLVGRRDDLVLRASSPSPASTMLQPSVVLAVSATWSGSAETSAAERGRAPARAAPSRARSTACRCGPRRSRGRARVAPPRTSRWRSARTSRR